MEEKIIHIGSRTNLLGENPKEDEIYLFSNEKCVNKETSPTFIVHANDDKIVSVKNSIHYFLSLHEQNIPVESYIYEKGRHVFGLIKNDKTNQHGIMRVK